MKQLFLIAIALSAAACGELNLSDDPSMSTDSDAPVDSEWQDGYHYLNDSAFREQALRDSLVNPENPYSAVRLENYTDDGWGALPLWNPRVTPVRPSDLGADPPVPDDTWQRFDAAAFAWNMDDLRQLGENVFYFFPIEVKPEMFQAVRSQQLAEQYGLWITADRVGGLVWMELPGGVFPAATCSTCHADTNASGVLRAGVPAHRYDQGLIYQDVAQALTETGEWGPGRVDVNADEVFNPSVIADIRPVAFAPYLQRAALIRNSIPALAIRIETGILTAGLQAQSRPPREAMLALSYYLNGLAEQLPPPPQDTAGAQIFARECATCHQGPGLNGDPVPMASVGTDQSVPSSVTRFTGTLQQPSLRGASQRRLFFSSGTVHSLDELLDADRAEQGHLFGTTLSDSEKAELLIFLNAL